MTVCILSPASIARGMLTRIGAQADGLVDLAGCVDTSVWGRAA
jgi:hypothetical protein